MVKNKLKNILISFLLFGIIFAQVPNIDITKLSNNQLDKLKEQLSNQNKDTSDDETQPDNTDEFIQIEPVTISETKTEIEEKSVYFGYDYFKKEINFFDNIPTPSEYKLGPGDEIILSLWGETNIREKFTVNKDGMIYYSNIGFINLSNKNIKEAELLLLDELSRIYSTLKNENNSTQLMLELAQLKSVNVYFSGHIKNPGINLVHPFSDIFSAIIQAGGINENGSLREVQLIRNGEIISIIDFYSFFVNGENTFSKIKIVDGDIIHIPNFKNRVEVTGEVIRPFIYELLPGESIKNIIEYASGLKSSASSSLIVDRIIPLEERSSDDNARTSLALNLKESESVLLNNGDSVNILPIPSVDLNISLFGRVKSPGTYPAYTSLKDILDIAGGFEDPIFRQTIREDEIIVLRQDINQFYGKEIIVSYKNAGKFKLEPNDKVFVYENINYKNSFTYRVEGEVERPGTYTFKKGISVNEALELAGGVTELSSLSNIIVFQEFTEVDSLGSELTSQIDVGSVSLDFELGPNSVIRAIPYENVVRVSGNVYSPGLVAFQKGLTTSGAIIKAGGYMPNSMRNRVHIKKSNGEIKKANRLRARAQRLDPGDTIVVPVDPEPSEFDITTFISNLSTTLANIAAILVVIDNKN